MSVKDRELWGTYALEYWRLWSLLTLRAMHNDVIEAARILASARVLDLGSGTGFLLRALMQSPGPYPAVTELDGLAEMLQQAKQVGYPGPVNYCRADLDTPVTSWGLDGPFDCIIMVNSLYVVQDPHRLLAGLTGLATPDTRLVVSTPKPKPDVVAVLTDHLQRVAEAGGDPVAERERIFSELGPIIALQPKIHFPNTDEVTLRSWFSNTGWQIDSLSSTYAGQNWLVRASQQSGS